MALSVAYLLVSLAAIAVYPFLSDVHKMVDYLALSFATVPAVMIGLNRTPPESQRASGFCSRRWSA